MFRVLVVVLAFLVPALPAGAQGNYGDPPVNLAVIDGTGTHSCDAGPIQTPDTNLRFTWEDPPYSYYRRWNIAVNYGECGLASGESFTTESVPAAWIAPGAGDYCWSVQGAQVEGYYNSEWSDCCCFTITGGATGCGDGVCSPSETIFRCPADCTMPPGATGRNGWPAPHGAVPAAVGGEPGVGGTFWRTEGIAYNVGDSPSVLRIEFVPDDNPTERLVVTYSLAPGEALYWTDLVGDLWGRSQNGSLWVDADEAVLFTTRTFTGPPAKATEGGTYGQGIHMVPSSLALEAGEEAYLLGLAEDAAFRTNVLLQAVREGAAVELVLRRPDGSEIGRRTLEVPAHAKVQRRLLGLFSLVGELSDAYMTVRVLEGGAVNAIASVIDATTGDATTVDAVHPLQVATAAKGQDAAAEAHAVVATVARLDGSNDTHWRSRMNVLNPAPTAQTVRLEYRPRGQVYQADLVVGPEQQVTVADVVGELFGAAGDGAGALHVYSPDGVIVNTRTFNQAAGTFGQAIPGLGAGDLIGPTQTGILAKLNRTAGTRCNMGFTEYQGVETNVSVTLLARSIGTLIPLASKQYTVAPYANLQVNRIFEDMGVNADYAGALAWVTVISAEGRVYAYASNVDNITGDAEFVPAQLR